MSPDLIVAFAAKLASLQSQYPNVSYIATDTAAQVLSTRCFDGATQPIAIDVRSPEEYAASHIPGAVRIDYNSSAADVMTFYSALSISNRSDVIVYCLSGKRASEFATTMMAVADGLTADGDPTGPKPQVIAGSIAKWVNEEKPLVTGENWPEYRIRVSPSSSSLKLVEPEFVFSPPSGSSGPPPGVGSGSGRPMFEIVEVVREGVCPDLAPVPEFDLAAYLGQWYEIQKYPHNFQVGLSCVQAEYSLRDDGKIKVNNTGIKDADGSPSSAIGEAFAEHATIGDLKVKFSPFSPVYGMYRVVATDYTGYSLVWSCQPVVGAEPSQPKNTQSLWILSRNRSMPDVHLANLRSQILDDFGLSLDELTSTDQENC